jgi:lipopolysaccharide export system permease protein
MIKKIDWFVFTSFIPPFVVAFMIAGFVLLMQTLWLYIDDIAGERTGFFAGDGVVRVQDSWFGAVGDAYCGVNFFGDGDGEYGRTVRVVQFQIGGVPLFRVMRSLILFGVFAAWVSYFCSDYVIPKANLKFGSRMYDITKQKPALRLDAGVFNYDFQGMPFILVKKKRTDGASKMF